MIGISNIGATTGLDFPHIFGLFVDHNIGACRSLLGVR